ncbi:RNA-directed DNA polymerase, eukaryota, reverse transcriptase zinc-binding domain protein, partial [Tanacetum coccineum]
LESIRSHFFNGHDPNSKRTYWVKWKNVLASKEKGGLGVSSLYALNRGLMFKWVWRFFTQNTSLWSPRVIKAIHGEDGKVGKQVKSAFPSYWMDIVHEINVLKNQGINLLNCMQIKLGNGDKTAFWEDIWIGHIVLKDLYPRWKWSLENSGDFSVASVRKMLDDKMLPDTVKLDSLPTRFNLSRRGLDIQWILCPICGKAAETTSHIFFSCSMVRDIYRKISTWWDFNLAEVSSFSEWRIWLSNIHLQGLLKEVLEGVFYIIWWLVWNFRNKLLFGKSIPLKATLFDDVVALLFLV